jgi:hypothetical protein
MTIAWKSATTGLALAIGAATAAGASESIPPSYELLETITVPPDGSIARSTTILANGVAYWLQASGEDPGAGDAEYDAAGNDLCAPGTPGSDVGVVVTSGLPSVASIYDKLPFWGQPDPAHEYAVGMTGKGAPVFVRYSDCAYDDNLGGLAVRIFGPRAWTRPRCEITFTLPTFMNGQPVTPRMVRITNNGTRPAAVEFKLWLRAPGLASVPLVNVGADSSVQLPAGYHKEYERIALFTVTPDFPRGTYELACVLSDPVTGEVLSRSVDRFGVR